MFTNGINISQKFAKFRRLHANGIADDDSELKKGHKMNQPIKNESKTQSERLVMMILYVMSNYFSESFEYETRDAKTSSIFHLVDIQQLKRLPKVYDKILIYFIVVRR